MAFPADYWSTYEIPVETLGGFLEVVSSLNSTWPDRSFVWRGVADADRPLHSSLYRRACAVEGRPLLEGTPAGSGTSIRSYESAIVDEARRWGLQRTGMDRLSALELLAALQHQGIPTRFLDFTHNAVVALWFAVEERRDNEGAPLPDVDGRVFFAQSNGRAIPETWARDPELPWHAEVPEDWIRDIYVWTLPPIDPRMTRQQGCFVFAGVPSTAGGWNVKIGAEPSRPMQAAEIRSCVSVPIRMNNPLYLSQPVARGRAPGYPLAFALRIAADSKANIRRDLEHGFGYTHRMLFPDYPGFAAFGNSIPRPAARIHDNVSKGTKIVESVGPVPTCFPRAVR